jgi:hypothetical protein
MGVQFIGPPSGVASIRPSPRFPGRREGHMSSREQNTIAAALASIPPQPGTRLIGFGLMAEWEEPNGERLLTRLIGDGGNPWQVKGYFHDGLNGAWPTNGSESGSAHHNPGHPRGWMKVA